MSEKNVWQKIAEARTKISVKKNGNNKFANYTYYQLNDIYTEAKKVFLELGLVTVFNMHKEREPITLTLKYKQGSEVMFKDVETPLYACTLDVINVDKPEEKATFSMEIPYSQQDGASFAQSLGGTSTYATKYLFLALLMLDDTEDDDAKNEHDKQPIASEKQSKNKADKQPEKPKDDVKTRLWAILQAQNIGKDDVQSFFIATMGKAMLNYQEYEELLGKIERGEITFDDDITMEQSAPVEPETIKKHKRV